MKISKYVCRPSRKKQHKKIYILVTNPRKLTTEDKSIVTPAAHVRTSSIDLRANTPRGAKQGKCRLVRILLNKNPLPSKFRYERCL